MTSNYVAEIQLPERATCVRQHVSVDIMYPDTSCSSVTHVSERHMSWCTRGIRQHWHRSKECCRLRRVSSSRSPATRPRDTSSSERAALAADLPEIDWKLMAGSQVIRWSDAGIHCGHAHGCRGRSVTGYTARRLERRLHCSTHQQSTWRPGFFSRCSSSLESSAAGWPQDRIVFDRRVETPLENISVNCVYCDWQHYCRSMLLSPSVYL